MTITRQNQGDKMQAFGEMAFTGGGLNRRAELRGDAAALLTTTRARVLPVWRGRPLVTGGDQSDRPLRLVLVAADHPLLDHGIGLRVFLGEAEGAWIFAEDLSPWEPGGETGADVGPGRAGADQLAPRLSGLPEDARFADLRGMVARLAPLDGEVAATARGILEWHRSHGFCAFCGQASAPAEGGWRRDCPACGRPHFPRTDPVVIMLVTRGNSLLVGRSPGWPEGFYSLLAGFMEPGETVEQAVRREVAEEAGVPVGRVRMVESQPWPFPASLMIGCTAEALAPAITLDPAELEDAMWISREDLVAAFAGLHPKMGRPRRGAIAHHLMQLWLADRLD